MNNITLSDILWFEPYLENFFPEEYFGKKGVVYRETFNNWDRNSFKFYLQNYTNTKNLPIEVSIDRLRTWKKNLLEGKTPEGNMPPKEVLENAQKVESAKDKFEAERLKKESLLESQKFAEKLQQIESQRIAKEAAQTEQVNIQETIDDTNVTTGQRLSTIPTRTVITWSSPYIDQADATAGELFVRGIRSNVLEEKFQGFQTNRQDEIAQLISNIRKYEEAFPGYAKLINPLSPKDISLLTSANSGFNQAQVALMMKPVGEGGISILPKGGPLGGILDRVGQQLFGKAASGFVNKALTSVAGKVASGAAVSTAAGTAASALTSVAGGPAGLLLFAAQYGKQILGKIADWISQNKEVFIGILGVASGFGIIAFGGPALAAFVPMAVGGMSLVGAAGGGMKGIGKGVSGFWNTVLAGFTTVFFPSIGIPFLITAITLPFVIAIIIFIINSGAYIVPPSESLLISENTFIEVTKDAVPSGPFENSDLPLKIKYNISVRAKKGMLTNLRFSHTCKVVSKNSQTNCEAPLPQDKPDSISPTAPYIFSYETTYSGNSYQNSLVINTFTVNADTSSSKNETTSGSASIIIGEAPTQCLALSGTWPGGYKANMESAIAYLATGYGNFVAKICSGGDLALKYNPSSVSYWGFYHKTYIDFYSGGLTSERDAKYILAHELAHALADRIPSIYMKYESTAGITSETPKCLYDYNTSLLEERFAESISFYAANPCSFSLQSKYPIHYRFVNENVFK
ncbi:MAG: hypothetical protein ABIJ05_04150 [Patescibacteria group bacterium]